MLDLRKPLLCHSFRFSSASLQVLRTGACSSLARVWRRTLNAFVLRLGPDQFCQHRVPAQLVTVASVKATAFGPHDLCELVAGTSHSLAIKWTADHQQLLALIPRHVIHSF